MVIATAIALVMHVLRQPLILGHILTGIIAGPFLFNIIESQAELELFSRIGIAALLFIVGLGLNPGVIKEVGKVSVYAGVGQVLFTSIFGFFIAYAFGFGLIPSIYIAIALTFSSTIIVLKILSDKQDIKKLYGKISTGILLVQDLIATVILVVLASIGSQEAASGQLMWLVIKGVIAVGVLVFVSRFILPVLARAFSQSQEFLFLFAIAWGLGLASLFQVLGFSVEIGALAAGMALAASPYQYEISSKMKLLRDFFIVAFFVLLGAHLSFMDVSRYLTPTIVLSLFVLVGNPIIMMVIMGWLGYNRRVSFLTGLTVAQISEFSLVLIILGRQLGHVGDEVVAVVTFVGLITIAISSYFMLWSDPILRVLNPVLKIFERDQLLVDKRKPEIYDAMLFGCHRLGLDFLPHLKRSRLDFLVIDFDPHMIEGLEKKRIPCRYGDASDNGFLEEFDLKKVKLAIITIPDGAAVANLISKIHTANRHSIVIATAHTVSEATGYYRLGASYVIMPHYLGGNYASLLIGKYGLDARRFKNEREKHVRHLNKRKDLAAGLYVSDS